MNRPLYAVCPRCGKRAKITGTARGRDEDEKIAQVKCTCGTAQLPYREGQILKIDLNTGWPNDLYNKRTVHMFDPETGEKMDLVWETGVTDRRNIGK